MAHIELFDKTIPTVDLGEFLNGAPAVQKKVASRVDHICRAIGFLIIENHNVNNDVIDAAWTAAAEFFALPETEKYSAQTTDIHCPRGFTPVEGESLAKTQGEDAPPDRKETFSSGPISPPEFHPHGDDFDFFYGANIWPKKPENFKEAWLSYYHAMEILGAQIMELLALALEVDKDYFKEYHTHHISALRTQNYPSLSRKILPGQLRAGAHSDYGSVTILKPDPDVDGLEVRSPNGDWIKAPVVKDGFIINIGDLLARWTNDRWVSTLHRVVEPESAQGENSKRRQSIAYFMNPNFDAEITAIPTCVKDGDRAKYPPVKAGDYLIDKFKQSN